MKKLSLYDLAYGYLKTYCGDEPDKTEVLNSIKKWLDAGWTAEELVKIMKSFKGKPYTHLVYHMTKNKPKSINLLKTETFYWHPQLRITPGAPVRHVDYDTGQITKVEEEHFLEMRASYTLEDMLAYYEKSHGETASGKRNKYLGGLKYLLTNHSIDTVLFMIDASTNFVKAEDLAPLSSPLDMDNYEREARHAMGEKITEEKQAGDDRIVPRRRVPLHRGRSKDKGREARV